MLLAIGSGRGVGEERKVGVLRDPRIFPELQNHRRPARPSERNSIFVEADRRPETDTPGQAFVTTRLKAIEVEAELSDVGPDPFPLMGHQRLQPRDNVHLGAERDDVVSEETGGCLVVDSGAAFSETGKPLADRTVQFGRGQDLITTFSRQTRITRYSCRGAPGSSAN